MKGRIAASTTSLARSRHRNKNERERERERESVARTRATTRLLRGTFHKTLFPEITKNDRYAPRRDTCAKSVLTHIRTRKTTTAEQFRPTHNDRQPSKPRNAFSDRHACRSSKRSRHCVARAPLAVWKNAHTDADHHCWMRSASSSSRILRLHAKLLAVLVRACPHYFSHSRLRCRNFNAFTSTIALSGLEAFPSGANRHGRRSVRLSSNPLSHSLSLLVVSSTA